MGTSGLQKSSRADNIGDSGPPHARRDCCFILLLTSDVGLAVQLLREMEANYRERLAAEVAQLECRLVAAVQPTAAGKELTG